VTPSLPAVFGVSWQYSFLLCSISISISVLCNCYGTGCNGVCFMGLLGPAEMAATEGGIRTAGATAGHVLCHRDSCTLALDQRTPHPPTPPPP
jgi:hypothetical protein